MVEKDISPCRVTGKVKWFDPIKGFGFVLDDMGGSDILLHANVLRNFGQNSIADMAEIEVLVHETQRGRQAIEVVAIQPPEGHGAAPIEDLDHCDPETLSALPMLPARIKWFDKCKGFGFANVFGQSEDVFIHIEVLRHSGFADLQAGEAVILRVVQGRRGLMAAQVQPWETAARGARPD